MPSAAGVEAAVAAEVDHVVVEEAEANRWVRRVAEAVSVSREVGEHRWVACREVAV